MIKNKSKYSCSYCGEEQQDLEKHYSDSHHNEIKEDYTSRNISRVELSKKLAITEQRLKLVLKDLNIRKSRSLVMKNHWSNLSDDDRAERIRLNNLNHDYKSQSHHKARLESLAKARAVTAKNIKTKEEEIFNQLDNNKKLVFSRLNNKIYKKYRIYRKTYHCDLCGREDSGRKDKTLHTDHDHNSNIIRGLLCYQCNCLMGWVDIYWAKINAYLSKGLSEENYYKGITPEGMVKGSIYSCEICEIRKPLRQYNIVVDHSHEFNKVRGLLCQKCNTRLGRIEYKYKIVKIYKGKG